MCSVEEYWARVARIPLFFDRDIADGEAKLYRTQSAEPVRVTRPEFFESDDARRMSIEFLESMYSAQKS